MPDFTMESTRARKRIRCSLPAVLMRAGTSKGLFVHRHNLPASESEWANPLLAAMGSQGSDVRQIDGVGGATSTTSKVAVIAPSNRVGIDVEYTFVQVAVGQESVDFSGNCGNMCSGVGPFALQEGLVHAKPGQRTLDVRIFNTNTSRVIIDTIQIDEYGSFEEGGSYSIPGVKGTGSEIKVAFVDPAGSMTGSLFPTRNRSDSLGVKDRNGSFFSVKATLIDAANPFVIVDENTLPLHLRNCTKKDSPNYLDDMEAIRRAGAVAMGLASSTDAAAKVRGTPKLAVVSITTQYERRKESGDKRIKVLAFSMGKPHPSLQLTGAACLAAAVCVPGTVAHGLATGNKTWRQQIDTPERSPSPVLSSPEDISSSSGSSSSILPSSPSSGAFSSPLLPAEETVCIEHASGEIDVGVRAASAGDVAIVERCVVSRTARRLFEGKVFYYTNA